MQGTLRGRRFAIGRPRTGPGDLAASRDGVTAPSRRTIVKGGLLAAAGALGWGASAATSGIGAQRAAATGTLTLQGARLRSGTGGPGRPALSGELVGSGGGATGSFSTTRLATPATGSEAPGTELQTFSLEDGLIFGVGTPPAQGEGRAVYAVIGGTGSYAGASGAYVADRRPIDRGGDGTAEFKFTFAN